MRNLFRVRVEAPESSEDQLYTFVDAGTSEGEVRLGTLVQWHHADVRAALEPVFHDFTRDYCRDLELASPATMFENLLVALDTQLAMLPATIQGHFDVGIVLVCRRSLYVLYSRDLEPRFSNGGAPQVLASTLRVRVRDLAPEDLAQAPAWSLNRRLRWVRVFFEDEDRIVLWMPAKGLPPEEITPDFEAKVGSRTPALESQGTARIIVVKEATPDTEAVEATAASGWPQLDDAPRRDRATLSYAALAVVVLLFGATLFGISRWRAGSEDLDRLSASEASILDEKIDSQFVNKPPSQVSPEEARTSREAEQSKASQAPGDDAAPTPAIATPAAGDDDDVAHTPPVAAGPAATTSTAAAAQAELPVLWSKRYPDWVTSSPQWVQGRVVYGCRDGNVYATDESGAPQWQYMSGAGIGASPEVDGTRLYCGNYKGQAFALRALDGLELWSRNLGARIVASPAAGRHHAFFATYAGELHAVDKRDGKLVWKQQVGGEIRAKPLPHDDDVIVISGKGDIYCLKQEDGNVRWKSTLGAEVLSDPERVKDMAVFGSKDGYLNAVSLKDGSFVWRLKTGGAVNSSPATNEAEDTIYVGCSNRKLYAVRARDGSTLWTFATKAAILSRPSVVGKKVYLTAYDHKSYVLDASSGKLLAHAELKAPIYSSPLVHEGRVFFGSNDGTFYCLAAAR